ncbi:MAG: MerR family transcriptional regulator [Bacillota bacterium]
MEKEQKLIPMRELERITGFTRATINFYIREGILPAPKKSAKNMAYYDENFIKRLNIIKKMKEDHKLSLQQMKNMFQATDYGMKPDLIVQVLNSIFHSIAPDTSFSPITWDKLVEESGLSEEMLQDLLNMKLIVPLPQKDEDTVLKFHPDSITMCKLVESCDKLGIPTTVVSSIVEHINRIVSIEVEAYINYVQKPMFERNEPTEKQIAAIQSCIELINSFITIIHMHILYRPIANWINFLNKTGADGLYQKPEE